MAFEVGSGVGPWVWQRKRTRPAWVPGVGGEGAGVGGWGGPASSRPVLRNSRTRGASPAPGDVCAPSRRTKRHPNNPSPCEGRLHVLCFTSDGIVFLRALSSLCLRLPNGGSGAISLSLMMGKLRRGPLSPNTF